MIQTSVIRLFLLPRTQKINDYADKSEAIQNKVLRRLVAASERTEWGRKYGYAQCDSYEDFASHVPISDYDGLKDYIERMRHGEKDILWPGQVKWYAKSSGTTNDKSKFIPVSAEGLRDTHYQGGTDCVAIYLQNNPDSCFADSQGKALILGGSHAPNYNLPQSLVGDLSAILIENVNPIVNLMRVPDKSIALISDFEEKMDRIAHAVKDVNVTNISGVPSWMLAVLKHTLDITGKSNLCELWPNLEVFFHGGVAFTPYREQYKKLIPSEKMHYEETYNASEGFFGIQDDPSDPALRLMIDYGIFYEFIPMSEFDKENPTIVPLWGVETGKNYAMVISTSCGLWRYVLGDTVRFTQKEPYKFVITGRTKHFINAFGEELIVDNAEKGLQHACEATGAHILEYTAAPVFMDGNGKCRHQWIIEFDVLPPDLKQFAELLDKSLQEINSDYEAKRYKDITLQSLEVIPARKGLFHDWLKEKGKLGGQHKVPRLSNTRQYIDELLAMNN
ncbi:MAG: GH3 auxin-responsive promoter family protein [Bacteroidaceae bacterium]|nr:GH3 auxin-responsive promoter family protein [Bacteroidaceae bacterium]